MSDLTSKYFSYLINKREGIASYFELFLRKIAQMASSQTGQLLILSPLILNLRSHVLSLNINLMTYYVLSVTDGKGYKQEEEFASTAKL